MLPKHVLYQIELHFDCLVQMVGFEPTITLESALLLSVVSVRKTSHPALKLCPQQLKANFLQLYISFLCMRLPIFATFALIWSRGWDSNPREALAHCVPSADRYQATDLPPDYLVDCDGIEPPPAYST